MSKSAPEYVEGHNLLAEKSVLITAAAGAGIGFAAAKRVVEEGARALVISDIHQGRLDAAVETLSALSTGCQVNGMMADVTDETAVQALVAFAEESTGGVDVLINNAGLGGSKRLVDMSDDEWLKVIDITLNGTMRMTLSIARVMRIVPFRVMSMTLSHSSSLISTSRFEPPSPALLINTSTPAVDSSANATSA